MKQLFSWQLIWRISTVISIGVLILSSPALGKDPFAEIALGSRIDLHLRELTDYGLVQDEYSLVLPQAGQPLLRFEGAMLVSSALEYLLAHGIDPNLTRPLGFSEGEILVWVSELAKNYTQATGDSLNQGQIESLALLVLEFGPELQILTGLLAQKPITLRVGTGEPWEFVDIDEISEEESQPEEIPNNTNETGIVHPSGPLMQLATEYFDYALQLQPPAVAFTNLAALQAEVKPDIIPQIFGPNAGLTSLSLEPQYLSWRRASQQQITLDEETGEIGTTSLYILDGQVPIGSGFTLGTVWATDRDIGLATDLSSIKSESRLTRAVSGEFQVVPNVSIIGELARSSIYSKDDKETEAEAKKLGAKVKLGEVELGANLRAVEAGFDPLTISPNDPLNTSGYDWSFKFKNLTLATEYSKNLLNAESTGQKSTSLNLNYSFAQRAVLKAGYKFVDIDMVENSDDSGEEDPESPPTIAPMVKEQQEASLGFDVHLDENTKLEAGFTLGWVTNPEGAIRSFDTKKASAGMLWRLPWEGDLEIRADYEIDSSKSQSKTKLGVGYNFLDNASLLVGYQLISFDSVDNLDESKTQTNLSAEISIQF